MEGTGLVELGNKQRRPPSKSYPKSRSRRCDFCSEGKHGIPSNEVPYEGFVRHLLNGFATYVVLGMFRNFSNKSEHWFPILHDLLACLSNRSL